MSKIKTKDNILVRGVNWIGDAVMTMPALRALKKAFPEAGISLLLKPSVAPIFEKDPNIDNIILCDCRFEGVTGRLRLAYELRKRRFSKALLFQNAFDAALTAFLAGIPERIGYDRDGRGALLTKRIPAHDDDRRLHHINYYLNLLTSAGVAADYSDPWLYLTVEERLSARAALAGLKRPILGINPGASYGSAKRWFPERFAEVAGWFIKDTGGSVVIFGGPSEAEAEMAAEIYNSAYRNIVSGQSLSYELGTQNSLLNLAGKTSLRELAALISECEVFVTNDSGPMHIACAVRTPLVAIFGSTDPVLTGPVGCRNEVVLGGVSCSPCFERKCKAKDMDMRCMYAITSDEVYHRLRKIMAETKAVFFDRDGTLCKDMHYLNSWDNFELLPGIPDLAGLKERGFKLIGVTNQSGVAKGLVNEAFAKEVNSFFIDKHGFDAFYYCPHHPEEHCSCRKPEPGMLLTARAEHMVNLKASYVIGDKEADMLLAKAAGAKGILVLTGHQKESVNADFVARDLKEAIAFIVA